MPLTNADATSLSATLSQVFARVKTTPSGNILVPTNAGGRPTGPGTLLPGAGGQVAAATATADNVVLIPLPRLNAILVAAQESRMPFVKSEIARLDIPNSGVAGAMRSRSPRRRPPRWRPC